MGRLKDIVFDCTDAWTLPQWWAETIGYQVRPHSDQDLAQLRAEGIERPEDDPNIAVDPVDGNGPSFFFCEVHEPKAVKNRVHVDVFGDVNELVRRGATVVDAQPRWIVMTDPEGNEFCVFSD
jgi:hypothetical protein